MLPITLIPKPQQIKRIGGESYLLHNSLIVAPETLNSEALYLANILRAATNFELPIVASSSTTTSCIRFELDEDLAIKLGAEGYRLVVQLNEIHIKSANPAGAFYAIQTLLQLLPPAIYGGSPRRDIAWRFPLVEIEDFPRFAWRGAMLDCARYFFPKAFIKRFIDQLALHKLNILHWHLTDDQGWRVEIKEHPRLTEVGAWRKESTFGSYFSHAGGDDVSHGGFYTQDDIREIVAYASERHIRIVPEIEMPGHASAAIAAYPELGCTGKEIEVSSKWGVHNTIFSCADRTIEFLQDVLEEIIALFPGEHIHIGGDEAEKAQWIDSPEMQRLMSTLGLPNEAALQSHFIARINQFIAKRGRKIIGWDEVLEGGLSKDVTVMSWRGVEAGIQAANAGHDVVMTPMEFTYFDFYQSVHVGNEPLAIGGYLPLEKVYRFEPLPPEIFPENRDRIKGVQAQLWSEYLPTEHAVEYMAHPRLAALSEVAWSEKEREWNDFLSRVQHHLKRLDVLRIVYRPLEASV